MEFFWTVIGVVLIVEGIPWFMAPEKVKSALRQIFSVPNSHLRLAGFACMVMGLLIVFLAVG